jgi:hypothetical protein
MTQANEAMVCTSQNPVPGGAAGFTFNVMNPGLNPTTTVGFLTLSMDLSGLAERVAADIFSSDAATSKQAVQRLVDGIRAANRNSDDKIMSAFGVPAVQIDHTDGRRIEIECDAAVTDVRIKSDMKAFVFRSGNSRLCRLFNTLGRYVPVNGAERGVEQESNCGFGGVPRRERFHFIPPIKIQGDRA